jgi:NAD(P)-dependent dehydrogenase (short-subunit alcohol dehydrogenase family)
VDIGLTGRVVVVTGGSSGIGRAIVEAYGSEGAKIAFTYNSDAEVASALVADLAQGGVEGLAIRLTLDDPASITAAFAEIVRRWGAIDVLIANAIAWPARGAFEHADFAEWLREISGNVAGTAGTIRAALPSMRKNGRGRIVLISSGSAEEGGAGASAYLTAKSALHGLARTLAWELGAANILVNVVAAGFTVTEKNLATIPDAMRQMVADRTPSQRLSTPADVAKLVVFLGSYANTNVSGEIVREGSSTGRSAHTR